MSDENNNETVDSIILPKGGSWNGSSSWEIGELSYPSVEEMVALVRDYISGKEKQAHAVIESFVPFVKTFIESLDTDYLNQTGDFAKFTARSKYLEQAWEEFLLSNVAGPFYLAIHEASYEDGTVPAEVLCYPMFAKRRICEILRVENERLMLEILCLHPLDCLTSQQLWHPNEENTASVREYYRGLAKAYIEGVENSDTPVSDFLEFCSLVKSPYRTMFEKFESFEIQKKQKRITAITIQQLCTTRTGVLHRIRDDQYMGANFGEITAPAPIQIRAIEEMTLSWLASESEMFFSNLPKRLLASIGELNIKLFQTLARQFGVEIGNFFKEIRENKEARELSRWLAPIEFPQIQKESFVYRQFAKMPEIESPKILSEDLLTLSLLIGVQKKNERTLDDFDRDRGRFLCGCQSIIKRKEERPWDAKDLFHELTLVEQRLMRVEITKKSIELKQKWIKDRLDAVDDDVLAANWQKFKESEERALTPNERVVEKVLEIADPLLMKIDLNKKISFDSVGILDPLFCADVFSFKHYADEIAQIQEHLKTESIYTVRDRYAEQADLAEHGIVLHAISKGKSKKSLFKNFESRIVERCLIECFDRTLEEFREENPDYRTTTYKVEERTRFEELLAQLTDYLPKLSTEIFNRVTKDSEFKTLSSIEKKFIKVTCDGIVWEWFFKNFENPYGSTPGSYEYDDIHTRRIMFCPWFEQELARQFRIDNKSFYQSLAIRAPVSCMGFESTCDFNWRNTPQAKNYISTLVDFYLEECRGITGEALLQNFKLLLDTMFSPFLALRDEQKYDLELLANYVLQLDLSQQHLFTTAERRILIRHWADFHQIVFSGMDEVSGLIAILFFQDLSKQNEEVFRLLFAEFNNTKRLDLFRLRAQAAGLKQRLGENFDDLLDSEIETADVRIAVSYVIKEALTELDAEK